MRYLESVGDLAECEHHVLESTKLDNELTGNIGDGQRDGRGGAGIWGPSDQLVVIGEGQDAILLLEEGATSRNGHVGSTCSDSIDGGRCQALGF